MVEKIRFYQTSMQFYVANEQNMLLDPYLALKADGLFAYVNGSKKWPNNFLSPVPDLYAKLC